MTDQSIQLSDSQQCYGKQRVDNNKQRRANCYLLSIAFNALSLKIRSINGRGGCGRMSPIFYVRVLGRDSQDPQATTKDFYKLKFGTKLA